MKEIITPPALAGFFDSSPVPAFVIDADHVVTVWNKACERITGVPAREMIGTSDHWRPFYPQRRPMLADLVADGADAAAINQHYQGKCLSSTLSDGYHVVAETGSVLAASGRRICFSAMALRDSHGAPAGAIEILHDLSPDGESQHEIQKAQMKLEELAGKRTAHLTQANGRLEDDIRKRGSGEAELLRRNAELTELNLKLSLAREQLVQSEKLASIGQLAAGVAHEINNPIGYIFSNFGALETYIARLLEMLAAHEQAEQVIAAPAVLANLRAVRERIELDYVREDIPLLIRESKEGIARVRKIVQDLKDFSRVDAHQEWQWANLHQGIDSTLNIVSNEVKYKADVIKEYGDLPEIECLPTQINQVIMNIVVNAAHAMHGERGRIIIRTGARGEEAWIEIADNGSGIPKEILPRIFDPFFTTKPVGSGTGLGLSLSYGIIQKHNGRMDVESAVGVGTTFRITLPLRHAAGEDSHPASP
jgi:two-component system NtrC family sensor kinase